MVYKLPPNGWITVLKNDVRNRAETDLNPAYGEAKRECCKHILQHSLPLVGEPSISMRKVSPK